MKAKQEIGKVMETRTLLNLTKHIGLGLVSIIKQNSRLIIMVLVAVAGSAVFGGSWWVWLVGLAVGKFVVRLVFTLALAVALYCLFYALIIGGILLILIY